MILNGYLNIFENLLVKFTELIKFKPVRKFKFNLNLEIVSVHTQRHT